MAKFNFRQGIVRRQEDGLGNGANLQPSNGGSYIDLIVSPDPTVFIIAHYTADYQLTENATISKAWGPFTAGIDYWLYWDVDFITGELTRGFTTFEPIVGSIAPVSPSVDQHWFDVGNTVTKVWSGSSWVEKIRVFACKYQNGSTIIDYPIGSQVGLGGIPTYAGAILFDPDGKPLQQFQRNRRGRFVTTETDLHSQFSRISNFRVEAAVVQGEASENIPISHVVAYSDYNMLMLSRNSDIAHQAIGVATEDMAQGEIRSYITKGFLTDEVNFNWTGTPAGTALFVGPTGEIIVSPDGGSLSHQQVGVVVNPTTIFVNILPQIQLEPVQGNEIVYHFDRDTGAVIGRRVVTMELGDLVDVDALNPQEGDMLIWNSTSDTWVLRSDCCEGSGGAWYSHEQAAASRDWVIVHNGGTENFVADVFDDAGNKVIPNSLSAVDINIVHVGFNTPQTGKANLMLLV